MLNKIRDSRIKHKFLLIFGFLIFIVMIAYVGLVENAKTNNFQRLERDHLGYVDMVLLHSRQLQDIKQPVQNSKGIRDILDKRSDSFVEMGLVQVLEGMAKIIGSFYGMINPIEEYFFRMAGFGSIFDIVDDGYEDVKIMQKTVGDYKNQGISYDMFREKLASFAKTVRGYDDAFAEVVSSASHFVYATMMLMFTIALILVGVMSLFIYREVMRSLNAAKESISTSSQELQANSKQQLQAISGQTASMTEISSVMQELAATSKQVADASSKTASLAGDTSKAVEDGQASLNHSIEGTNKIKERVETIVSNMLSLGEKSQQIGVVLDVINELSQQVTVLSYNATIEAAGAGEMGKRFMAVADRIIKLAERSVASGKEIKTIIDDIQTDSNKTIMSTEDGMKAVKEGIAASMGVQESLDKISGFSKHVLSSADEINLSLNQQKTSVEQAASEMEDITSLVRETEDASKQVLETANQLLDMSEMLERL